VQTRSCRRSFSKHKHKIIDQGERYLGDVIDTESLKDQLVKNKVDDWVQRFSIHFEAHTLSVRKNHFCTPCTF